MIEDGGVFMPCFGGMGFVCGGVFDARQTSSHA
jgi:hypothetical protein